MTDQEVNRIIAEYMGVKVSNKHSTVGTIWKFAELPKNYILDFTESLDALVPVWEKLAPEIKIRLNIYQGRNTKAYFPMAELHGYDPFKKILESISDNERESIQQASAHATAKAIKELSK